MNEILNQTLDELGRIQVQIMELRHKISLFLVKPEKDEVEQAFDECEKSDDEAADQDTLAP